MARAKVEFGDDYISVSDAKGEIVYWDEQEWIEDTSLVKRIANACYLAGKGEDLRKRFGGR